MEKILHHFARPIHQKLQHSGDHNRFKLSSIRGTLHPKALAKHQACNRLSQALAFVNSHCTSICGSVCDWAMTTWLAGVGTWCLGFRKASISQDTHTDVERATGKLTARFSCSCSMYGYLRAEPRFQMCVGDSQYVCRMLKRVPPIPKDP